MIPIKDNIPTDRFPLVTLALIAANVVVYVLACAHGGSLIGGPDTHELARWGATPHALTGGHGYGTVFSSMFVQASIVALLGNLLFLWLVGGNVEDAMGRLPFLAFYVVGGVLALALEVAVSPDSTTPIVGAAGATAALLGGYLVLYPSARVLTLVLIPFLFTVIEVPIMVMLAVWIALQAAFAAAGLIAAGAPVAYLNYIGGLAFGALAVRRLATRRKPTPPTAAAYR
ncbi:MAG: rhomboid family intramembrane serine protease [Solirubrobacteraceae bacterium]